MTCAAGADITAAAGGAGDDNVQALQKPWAYRQFGQPGQSRVCLMTETHPAVLLPLLLCDASACKCSSTAWCGCGWLLDGPCAFVRTGSGSHASLKQLLKTR